MRAFANCHSHVFHRAMRGRAVGDSFWSWRDDMYTLAAVLDPDLLHRLARATYAEMRLAGIDAVGEFHYLHHQSGGAAYEDPNAMGEAVISAAREVGLSICLLDTCYLAAGFDQKTDGVQRRFDDGDAEQWASRVHDLAARHDDELDVVIGAAVHSVRAVPREQIPVVADALPDAPLHVHVSEQPAENKACLAVNGMTPVALLDDAGVWTARTTAVHATHLTGGDVRILGGSGAFVCFCPTTEADLADGIGPSVALRDAGARLTLGSDGHTVIDMFAEARAVELHERLASGRRGSWTADQLWDAATTTGYDSLGFDASGTIELEPTVRTAGSDETLWSATAADVVAPPDLDPAEVAHDLAAAIDECWSRV
jgi:formiminoglutamate deiminase